jgi:hypothetical protein
MNFKLKEEMNYPLVLNNLIDDYACLNIELGTLAMNMKKEVYEVIDYFLSFLINMRKRKFIICYPWCEILNSKVEGFF